MAHQIAALSTPPHSAFRMNMSLNSQDFHVTGNKHKVNFQFHLNFSMIYLLFKETEFKDYVAILNALNVNGEPRVLTSINSEGMRKISKT